MATSKKFIYIDEKRLETKFAKDRNLRMSGIYQLTYLNGKLHKHELISASPNKKLINMCKKATEEFFKLESFKGIKPKANVVKEKPKEVEENEMEEEEVLTEVPETKEETKEEVLTEVPESQNEELLEESSEKPE